MKKFEVFVDLNDGSNLQTIVEGESKESVGESILEDFEVGYCLNPMGNNININRVEAGLVILDYNAQAGVPKVIRQPKYAVKIGDIVVPTINVRSVSVQGEVK
jgi:hypothetical protein